MKILCVLFWRDFRFCEVVGFYRNKNNNNNNNNNKKKHQKRNTRAIINIMYVSNTMIYFKLRALTVCRIFAVFFFPLAAVVVVVVVIIHTFFMFRPIDKRRKQNKKIKINDFIIYRWSFLLL